MTRMMANVANEYYWKQNLTMKRTNITRKKFFHFVPFVIFVVMN
jgi:hypothetical protein